MYISVEIHEVKFTFTVSITVYKYLTLTTSACRGLFEWNKKNPIRNLIVTLAPVFVGFMLLVYQTMNHRIREQKEKASNWNLQ